MVQVLMLPVKNIWVCLRVKQNPKTRKQHCHPYSLVMRMFALNQE
uniref:Uncharacterized protein n=1 Tax=Anguilla anguilla TaxID=7936 RepID=A0A0E9XCA4_ANGAN